MASHFPTWVSDIFNEGRRLHAVLQVALKSRVGLTENHPNGEVK